MADQENIGTLLSKIAVDVADLKKGLSDGRNELNSFKKLSQEVGEQVKKALTFAGIGFGLYEGLSKLKEFASEILDVGKKTEMLRISTYVLAQNLKMSADTVDYYVAKLTGLGLTTERSFHAIQAFLKSGLPIDQIAPFIETLRNIAPTVTSTGGAFGPFFDQIMKSMESGRPRGLMQMGIPGFQEFLISLKKDGDEAMMTITEKAQALYDYLTQYSQSLKGVSEAVGDTYVSQAAKLERLKTETKEALFELVKPVAMAISGEQIKTWDDLYVAVTKNKTALKDLGETIAIYVGRIANFIRTIAEFAVAHKELVEVLLQVWTISKVINFLSISAGAAAATLAIGGTISKLAALRLALAGPWGLVIAVTIVGLYEGIKAIDAAVKKKPSVGTAMGMGEAQWAMSEKDRASQMAADKVADEAADLEALKKRAKAGGRPKEGMPSAMGGAVGSEISESDAKKQANAAAQEQAKRLKDLLGDTSKGGKGGGGKSEEGKEYDAQVREYLKMVETIRQADLKSAESGIEILKAEHAAKKSELEKQLAEGLISGQTYYERLQEMEDGETKAALALIDKKKQAQLQAHRDALKGVALEDSSPEIKAYKNYDLEMKNRAELAKLEADAVKTKLEGEKRVSDELKRQVELRQQYQEKTEALNIETAALMGAISSQEATLQKLYLDWQNAKRQALKEGGYTPEYAAALDKNLAAKQADAKYGGYSQQITQGISSLVDAMMKGGQDLKAAANNVFKGLFNEALKPGLEQLKGLLTKGFQDLFGAAGSGIASAVMGAIGLIGMLLTSGNSKSSFTSSGVTSAVTAHEAVRGIIAGPTSTPIAEIGTSLQDALVPTNGILLDIKALLAGGRGAAGSTGSSNLVQINAVSFDILKEWLDKYFQDYLMHGAPA
jgi:hypothetical protein